MRLVRFYSLESDSGEKCVTKKGDWKVKLDLCRNCQVIHQPRKKREAKERSEHAISAFDVNQYTVRWIEGYCYIRFP